MKVKEEGKQSKEKYRIQNQKTKGKRVNEVIINNVSEIIKPKKGGFRITTREKDLLEFVLDQKFASQGMLYARYKQWLWKFFWALKMSFIKVNELYQFPRSQPEIVWMRE